MVDREAIEQALRRIADDTWSDTDKAIQKTQGEVMMAGRSGSYAHNSMVTTAASEAYRAGLVSMVTQVRSYAGKTASAHVDLLTAAADRVKDRLIEAHESRLTALAGKYPSVEKQHALYIGSFTKALTDACNAAISDLQHTLSEPEDALPWWQRTRTKDHAVGFVLGIIATIAGAYLLKLLGLS